MITQRAVEDEFDRWLGRARYERRPEGPSGKRNGFRPRHLQTAEGELRIEIPQVRDTIRPFVLKLFPKWHCKRLLRTDPLKALVIGGFVRGLSMRDVESLCEEAGLGKTSRRPAGIALMRVGELTSECICTRLAIGLAIASVSSTRHRADSRPQAPDALRPGGANDFTRERSG